MTNNPAIGRFQVISAWPLLARILAALFIVASIGNVLGIVWTKPFLMPLLLLWAVTIMYSQRLSGAWRVWLVVALCFSWLGDLALMGTGYTWFLAGIGAFAVAQISYIVMFRDIPGTNLVWAWKIALIPYLGFWVILNFLITPGDLRIPVFIYSALLIGMAISALNCALRLQSPWRFFPAFGAASFVFSDTLIAIKEFNGIPVFSSVIMATYLVGQTLIVMGIVLGQAPTGSTSRNR